MLLNHDGMWLRSEIPNIVTAGVETPIGIVVGPADVAERVPVRYRTNGGDWAELAVELLPDDDQVEGRPFRADLPAFAAGDVVEVELVGHPKPSAARPATLRVLPGRA